ncbi:MAG: protein translocase subunit SecD [Candidatus Schekmanbacteria bacterium]|nr:MAG: protein translocase subunit SecD [Candidatus Schekmanbacteria bacterium]
MDKTLKWKIGLVAVLVVLSLWVSYPIKEKINLGLDLQGGVHLLMGVDTEKAVINETIRMKSYIERALKEKKIKVESTDVQKDKSFNLSFISQEAKEKAKDVIEDIYPESNIQDVDGKTLKISMSQKMLNNYVNLTVQQAVEVLRNRVDKFGVSEPIIQRQGRDRIVIQLPGLDDPARAKKVISTGGVLEFKLVIDSGPSPESIMEKYNQKLPEGTEILPIETPGEEGEGAIRGYVLVKKEAEITGKYLKDARVGQDQYGLPSVNFEFNSEGAEIFGNVTEKNIGKQLAIILDGKVQSSPVIRSRITDRGEITGNFSYEEAQDLVVILRAGALPAVLEYLEERTVGPSLGADSIRAGVIASIAGFILIVIAMVVYYRWSGLVANFALLLNGIFLIAAMSYFKFTLTLPGIAGIVLTLGMAVDANVLIYERIREELRLGRTVRSAVDMGFSKAFGTILDSNITTLIAGLVMFQFGTGPIKGFAVTLSIGLIISMFTAVFVSRIIFDMRIGSKKVTKLSI